MVPKDLVLRLLKKRIADLGLTYREAAERCGVGATCKLAQWLNAEIHLPAPQLERILRGLDFGKEAKRKVVLAYVVYELPPGAGEDLLRHAGLLPEVEGLG